MAINHQLVNARKELGYTQKEAAKMIGISLPLFSNYENMNKYPSSVIQEKICSFYRDRGVFLFEDDVFPKELQILQKNPPQYAIRKHEIEKAIFEGPYTSPDSLPSPETGPHERSCKINLAEQTRKVLADLTPREEKVLKMRFGIGKKRDQTLEEIGNDFAVTKERIRNIEAKALQRLRYPTRSQKLKDFLKD